MKNEIGLYGLGVMGQSLVLNIAKKEKLYPINTITIA